MEGRAPAGPAVDSARANLAATFVNGFVNAGFGSDKLVTVDPVRLPVHGLAESAQAFLCDAVMWTEQLTDEL